MLFSGAGMEKKVRWWLGWLEGVSEGGRHTGRRGMFTSPTSSRRSMMHSGPPQAACLFCAMQLHSPASSAAPLQVEWLSGGEKARLALAKFMLTQVRGPGRLVWQA